MIEPLAARRETPENAADLGALLAECDATGAGVRIDAGKTLCAMGMPLERCSLEIDMRGMRALIAHEHEDLVCAVEAGIGVRELSEALAERRQFIPIDAPLAKQATAGGTLGAGWLGPRRHIYGPARDYVIGSHAVLADGTAVKAGGMVVKNVAGYDMSKLYAGSFGTLAVLTRLNFKTLPLPERTRAILAPFPERTRVRAIPQIAALAIPPAAAFYVEGFRKSVDGVDDAEGRAVVILQGSSALVDRATRDLRSALGRAGVPGAAIVDDGALQTFERALDAGLETLGERSVTYRLFGASATLAERMDGLRKIAARHELTCEFLADVMNGDVFVRVSGRDSRAFAARIETFDDDLHAAYPRAAVVATKSPVRSSLAVWGALPPTIDRMREIKARFDPRRILNPGRFVGGM